MKTSLGQWMRAARRRLDASRLWFSVLLASYVALAVAYSLVTPIYEPTDEIRHVRYVRHLTVYRSLPVQSAEGPRAQSHHPPLYYVLGALVSWWVPVEEDVYYEPPRNPHWTNRFDEVSVDNKNQYLRSGDDRFPLQGITLAVQAMRWVTIIIGAGAVWLTYRLGRRVFPDRPAVAWCGAALLAFNPQFLHLSGAVNNDVPATLWGAAVSLICVRLIQSGPNRRTDVTLGILFGSALLTKFHLVALAGPIVLAYVMSAWDSGDWRPLVRGPVIVFGVVALISGWWFWRNHALYGDPTGMKKVNELWAGRPAAGNWWALRQGLPYLWSSMWGRFGYGQMPLHQSVYRGLLVLCAAAMIGYLAPGKDRLPIAPLMLLTATILAFLAAVSYYILIQPAGAMGRFLFPGLPAFALLVSYGLSRLFPQEANKLPSVSVGLGAAALALYALLGVLAPAYGRPPSLSESEIASVPNPVGAEFGGVAQLLGYQVRPNVVEPGDTIDVTLYWQALARTDRNHVVFVHLLSDAGPMIAQRDTYPGLGRYPSTAWENGVAFADTYRVQVPETAYAPDSGYVQVGLYVPDGQRLTTDDGRDALRLARIEVQPRPGEFPNSQKANFGNEIALVGYKLDRRVAQPGEAIGLTLYWQTLAPMQGDYRGFAHVLGAGDQIWANSDSRLVDGPAPTSEWQVGQVVTEERILLVDPTTPSDFYDIEVGVCRADGSRLPVIAEGGHQLGSRVLLSKIRVEVR
ncbi:MAG: glycosyltransferase family 39 protein [Chloroflexota bacterium]|nr:glycosyltransferase family 39 protein [Chloroflexota bacterium]